MGKILIVTEKPSVAMDIGKVLNCTSKGNGYIYNDKYTITWCVGHLVELYEPEDYDPKYKKWSLDSLPIIPEKMKYKPVKKTYSQFQIVKGLMNSNEFDYIIEGTDAGREGENIYRSTMYLAGCKKPFKRLWISSMTPKAISEGLANLRPSSEFDNLYRAAKCRSDSDWLVGINGSRSFSCKFNSNLSIGRVQTSILAIIVNRYVEIQKFVPKDYWELSSIYDNFTGLWINTDTNDSKLLDKNEAENLLSKLKGKNAVISHITNEDKQKPHPLLYNLSELQGDANKYYKFTAKKTLNIAQSLYETHKLITYPRTDSQYISNDIVPTLNTRLSSINTGIYKKFVNQINSMGKIQISKRVVDDSKITDHHALLPTEIAPNFSNLSEDEKKIYDLIVKRFLSIFYPPYKYKATTVKTLIDDETFISRGKTVLDLGWTVIYKGESISDEKEEEQVIPNLKAGTSLIVNDIKLIEKQTKPPSMFTERTLLKAMDYSGKFIEDEKLQEEFKKLPLGTAATRADIIEKLVHVEYIKREKNFLIPTEKGINLINIVPSELKSPEMTGKWEKCLTLISEGKMETQKFMDSIIRFTNFIVDEAKKANGVTFGGNKSKRSGGETPSPTENKVLGKCPNCGSNVLDKNKGFICSNYGNECKFAIWKNDKLLEKFKKKPTETMVKALLKDKKTVIKGLTSSKGTKFDSEVELIKQASGYWGFNFNFNKK